jgi:hypothetical protein
MASRPPTLRGVRYTPLILLLAACNTNSLGYAAEASAVRIVNDVAVPLGPSPSAPVRIMAQLYRDTGTGPIGSPIASLSIPAGATGCFLVSPVAVATEPQVIRGSLDSTDITVTADTNGTTWSGVLRGNAFDSAAAAPATFPATSPETATWVVTSAAAATRGTISFGVSALPIAQDTFASCQ